MLALQRNRAGAFTDVEIALANSFVDQARIAIENTRLFNETKEALDQQRASGEVLAAISSSIADTTPVFERILQSCERLFSGKVAGINLVGEDGLIHLRAYHGPGREELERVFPLPVDYTSGSGASITTGRVIHYPDVEADGVPESTRRGCRAAGYKGVIFAPMIWEGRGIGVIFVGRDYVGAFSDKDIALLETFANQAVIAIQNARLFNETQEALEQQTATAEVLQVISSSIADTGPVFDKILDSCQHLFATDQLGVMLLGDDGRVHARAGRGSAFDALARDIGSMPLETTFTGRAIRERRTVRTTEADMATVAHPAARRLAESLGPYTAIYSPMIWEGRGVGAICIFRQPPRPFADKEVALLETFADQAVIAIQNARLFNETKEALERQTATTEVLKVISESQTDVQPVFDVIAERAARLTGADYGWVLRFDGELIHVASAHGVNAQGLEAATRAFPMPPGDGSAAAHVVRDGVVVNIADVLAEDADYKVKPIATLAGYRSVLSVPMRREDQIIGVITVTRARVGRFADKEVDLLQTFARQAVIAIENVRLFNETKEALEQQTATAEVLQVISSSVADTAPVFDKILESGQHLFATEQLGIFLIKDDGQVHAAAWRGKALEAVARTFPKPVEHTMTARVIRERRTVHAPDAGAIPGAAGRRAGRRRPDRELLGGLGADDMGRQGRRLDHRTAPAAQALHR